MTEDATVAAAASGAATATNSADGGEVKVSKNALKKQVTLIDLFSVLEVYRPSRRVDACSIRLSCREVRFLSAVHTTGRLSYRVSRITAHLCIGLEHLEHEGHFLRALCSSDSNEVSLFLVSSVRHRVLGCQSPILLHKHCTASIYVIMAKVPWSLRCSRRPKKRLPRVMHAVTRTCPPSCFQIAGSRRMDRVPAVQTVF